MHTQESPTRLLLVEDDTTTQEFFRATLAALPGTVTVAGSLAQALQITADTRHALWLIDVNLPDGTGPQLLQQLRTRYPGVPALAHTANDTPALRQTLLHAGFAEVLIKPMPSHVLLTAVHTLLGTAPASLPSAEAAPVPDWDEGAAMLALNGQNAHVMALRELFIKELPDVHAAVSTALQQHDTSALRVQLHRLQASCGFVGASRLGRAVRQLHQAPESAMAQRQFEAAASALLRR